MKLVTRLFITTSLLLAVAVGGLIVAADRLLRRYLEEEIAHGLAREARLVALLLPADSLTWPEAARALGQRIGHRITLIDPTGKVRGDTEFDRASLAQLENHLTRPEVRAAIGGGSGQGIGQDERLSASTNERRLYVAVRGGPPGLAVVRVSTTLAVVDGQVGRVQGAVALAGFTALLATALFAWLFSREVARPLVQLAGAARAIAAGQAPSFPQSRAPEVAQHILALRAMHEELDLRFAELRREREETATLIETMADGVLAADARGGIVTLNTAARRLLGYGPADHLPPLAELFHDKPARELVDAILSGRDGEPVDLALENRALLIAGRALPNSGALLVIRDVTDLRRLETVRRDFVANVSHELKTPLTSIAGYAETLTAEVGAGTQSERFAQTILSNARRMQRLVDDLLDLSRIESGGWQPLLKPVDVAGVARETWVPFADRARDRRIDFTVTVAPPGDGARFAADPDALRQILTNLFDNALRYTPPGGRIVVAAGPTTGGTLLTVSDNGSGITGQHLPRVFERFYRADPARSRDQGGTGLGLAIVKHLVEAHGGWVEAQSAPGRGTTIRMVFPRASGSL